MMRAEGDPVVKSGRRYYRNKQMLADVPSIDTSRMCVPCVISTEHEDRQFDVVVTAGGILDFHMANPAVMCNHGLADPALNVAKAEDPDGQYTVMKMPGHLRAVSWFTNSIQESEQTFALIHEGLMRGTSIGFNLLKGEPRWAGPDGRQGTTALVWEMFEYSHCPVGVNPYSLVDRIQKSICGKSVSAKLYKSLTPYLPRLKEMTQGADLAATSKHDAHDDSETRGGENPMSAATATVTKAVPPGMGETAGGDGGYITLPEERHGAKTGTPLEDTVGEEHADSDMLPGAQALAHLHGLCSGIGEAVTHHYGKQENPKVTAALDHASEHVAGLMDHLNDTFKAEYPDYEAPGGAPAGETVDAGEEKPKDDTTDELDDDKQEDDSEVFKSLKLSKRMSEAGKRLAVKSYKAMKMREAALIASHTKIKRMSKAHTGKLTDAAECMDDVVAHQGELKSMHRTALSHHSRVLKEMAAGPVDDVAPEAGGEVMKSMDALKARIASLEAENASLKEENTKYKAKLPVMQKNHENLVAKYKGLLNGR